MQEENELTYKKSVFLIPLLLVSLCWIIYWIEIKFDLNFNKLGIYPRTVKGLRGVVFSPFIHGDASHVFSNSVPFFVLLSSLFYFYRNVAVKVLIFGGLLSGLLTWVIARESYHIGASGIVYLLFGFILFSGLIKKHYRLVALSFAVIFLYGGMVWYILPIKDGMSWEGHLSGLIIGILFAFFFKKKGIVKEEYEFSKTEFDDYFDEDGNFNPNKE